MPAPTVKPTAHVVSKWVRRVGAATEDYRAGVQGKGGKWAQNASAAHGNYTAGVTQAAQAGRFAKGIARVGPGKYEHGATVKGTERYGPGAMAGEQYFSAGIAPVLEAIGRTDLPPRGPRGAEGNYNRSTTMAKALRTFKQGR
jgi:hypothetical protein